MLKKAQTGIRQGDSAVKAENLSKIFTQNLRENEPGKVLKNFLRPQKKIIKALDGVNFTIEEGEFVAYAGPNGRRQVHHHENIKRHAGADGREHIGFGYVSC